MDQKQELKERRDVIAREERRPEKRKAEKARTKTAELASALKKGLYLQLRVNHGTKWWYVFLL